MREPFDQSFWTELKQERRRVYTIFLAVLAFTLMMPFAQIPEHHLAIGLGCIACLIVIVFAPGRWFYRSRPELMNRPSRPELRSGGPRPRLRSQPPPSPFRGPLTRWPQREGPLPPLPPRRRPH